MRGLSLVAASGGHSSSWRAGLSLSQPLLLRSTGSRRAGSVVVGHRPSCSAARGILPDQGSNPCPLHWQADSQQLRHQGSPILDFNPILLYLFVLRLLQLWPLGSSSPLLCPFDITPSLWGFLSTLLLSGTTRCSRIILYISCPSLFFFFFGCVGSLLLRVGFLWLR